MTVGGDRVYQQGQKVSTEGSIVTTTRPDAFTDFLLSIAFSHIRVPRTRLPFWYFLATIIILHLHD
jgi:hypothetical protein